MLAGKKIADPARVSETPTMIDGEECGTTPMRVTVLPRAVTVLVPPQSAEVPRKLVEEEPMAHSLPGLLENLDITHQLNRDDFELRDTG